jgi:hypothetical protein
MGVDGRALLAEQRISAGLVGVVVRVEEDAYLCAAEARSHCVG